MKLALVFFAAIVTALILSFSVTTPKSGAQTGYGAPQALPDQTIEPISHGSSNTGLVAGVGAAVVILGGAVGYGWHRHNHPGEHPYP